MAYSSTRKLLGCVCTDRYGDKYEVISAESSENILIRYIKYGNVESTKAPNIRSGFVSNRMRKTICGVGYIGVGNFRPVVDGEKTLAYIKWHSMLSRCYSEQKSQSTIKSGLCYREARVSEEWHNFQNFAEWFNSEISKITCADEVICLDKDILSASKTYSKETCLLVPYKINIAVQLGSKKEFELAHVYYCSKRNKYCAGITKDGKLTRGRFQNKQEAIDFYFKEKSAYLLELINRYKYKLPKETAGAVINYAENLLSKEKRKELLANIV